LRSLGPEKTGFNVIIKLIATRLIAPFSFSEGTAKVFQILRNWCSEMNFA